jgi:hypothetical protein
VSQRLGRRDTAPAATETATTVRQTPTEAPFSTHPPALQAQPDSGISQLPPARDSHLYLPSIRILRNRHDASRPEANTGAFHDYVENPREADRTVNGRQGNLRTKARQSWGFGHGERDSLPSERDYDPDTMVDALDALGTCPIIPGPLKNFLVLTSTVRSRSSNLGVSDQRSELAFSSQPRQVRE